MMGDNMKDYMVDSPKTSKGPKGSHSIANSPKAATTDSLIGSDDKKNKNSALRKRA